MSISDQENTSLLEVSIERFREPWGTDPGQPLGKHKCINLRLIQKDYHQIQINGK